MQSYGGSVERVGQCDGACRVCRCVRGDEALEIPLVAGIPIHMSVHMSIHMSIDMSMHMSIHMSKHASVFDRVPFDNAITHCP